MKILSFILIATCLPLMSCVSTLQQDPALRAPTSDATVLVPGQSVEVDGRQIVCSGAAGLQKVYYCQKDCQGSSSNDSRYLVTDIYNATGQRTSKSCSDMNFSDQCHKAAIRGNIKASNVLERSYSCGDSCQGSSGSQQYLIIRMFDSMGKPLPTVCDDMGSASACASAVEQLGN